ncbi:unnamed protein product [Ectocarpus sp. 12 AP-2014]
MADMDRGALKAFFRSTGGVRWKRKDNWDTAAGLHVATWLGVEVNHQGRVMKLSLDKNNLQGPMPAELGALAELKELWLHINKLEGPITPEIGSLAALRLLYLGGNQLSGCIPGALGFLSNLEVLRLENNQLSGPIPQELGKLTALTYLNLSENKLSGPIPKELEALTDLKRIVLFDNQLTALWDHTHYIQDIVHERALGTSVGLIPSQLCRLLDVLDRAEGGILSLEDNPWAEPPESIVAKGPKSIRGYFEDLYAEPCRVQRSSVKVILVGQEGAGKTSLRQSMKANEATPTGDWKEESTVFADVEPMELEGSSVRVYDCAGQAAYTGLLQMFLTPRSVCVLVCNAEAFGQRRGNDTGGQITEDCRKLEELRVCEWLRSISRRVPDNDAILVATKCDLVGGNASEVGRRMEQACRVWLSSWVRNGMQPVRLEHGVGLTSCRPTRVGEHGERGTANHALEGGWVCDWRGHIDDDSAPSLLHRLVNKPEGGGPRGTQLVLPRSWDIALTFLEALESGRDPAEVVVHKSGSAGRGDAAEMTAANAGGYQGITVEDLIAKWLETVDELARREITVTNAKNALEGALSIRYTEEA